MEWVTNYPAREDGTKWVIQYPSEGTMKAIEIPGHGMWKECTACKRVLKASTHHFFKDSKQGDQLDHYCRTCRARYKRERYAKRKAVTP